jgi:hypothetical protein
MEAFIEGMVLPRQFLVPGIDLQAGSGCGRSGDIMSIRHTQPPWFVL